jgi:hypothetical protein
LKQQIIRKKTSLSTGNCLANVYEAVVVDSKERRSCDTPSLADQQVGPDATSQSGINTIGEPYYTTPQCLSHCIGRQNSDNGFCVRP